MTNICTKPNLSACNLQFFSGEAHPLWGGVIPYPLLSPFGFAGDSVLESSALQHLFALPQSNTSRSATVSS